MELKTGRARVCRERRSPTDRRRKLWPLAAVHLEELTTASVSDFLVGQVRVKGLAPKTANRYREILGKLINWAMESGRVRMPMDRNPVARVERYRENAPEIRYLTLAQIDEQLEVLTDAPQLRAMVATLIFAGLRREELLWLQQDDLVPGTAQAPNGLLRVQAKTINDKSWQPKTARNRVVPVSKSLRRILDCYTPPSSADRWLFPSPRGQRWEPDNFSHALATANEAVGLPWACLEYRHTFGSQLAQRGISLFQIAALMGNSPDICRRHYAAVANEQMAAEVEFAADLRH